VNLAASNPLSWCKQLRRPSRGAADLLLTGMAYGASAPLAFAANILIARLLGPQGFGTYITFLSAALVMGGVAAYGVGPVLTREISGSPIDQRRAIVLAMARWALSLTGVLSLAAIVVLLVWLIFVPSELSNSWPERIAAAGIIPTFVWASMVSGILGGLSLVAKSQVIGNTLKNGLLLLGAGLLLFSGMHQAVDALWLQIIVSVLAASVGAFWVWRAISHDVDHIPPTVEAPEALDARSRHGTWRRAAGHFFAMTMAMLILGRIDVVIVNALSGPFQAGIFGAAARLAQIAAIAGLVWVAWLQPRVSKLFRSGQKVALRKVLKLGLIGAVGMTGALILVGWFLAPWIMALMGAGFEGAVAPFRWLLLGYLAWAVSIPFYVALGMTGLESILSKILWGQLAITLAASFPLVHFYGAIGCAWAWASGLVVGSVCIISAGYFYRAKDLNHAV